MARKTSFKLALGLWINPDFSLVERGLAEPPRVDHSKLDYAALRAALRETFVYGPRVDLLVPNDTIDQVTIHTRAGMLGTQAPDLMAARCCDFGEAMLGCVSKAKDGVIDVRSAWGPLHALHVRDRTFAPPPMLLPFVILADDFEDSQIWQASCRPVLGLRPFDVFEPIREESSDHEGRLPENLRQRLHEIFGSPFESMAMLGRMASDRPPIGYGLGTL